MKLLLVVFVISVVCNASYAIALVDDRQIRIKSVAELNSKRQALIDHIWGTDGFPTSSMPKLPVIANDKSPVPDLVDLERVDTLIFEMENGLKSYAHHFIPIQKNNRLVILHAGHLSTFADVPGSWDEGFGMRRTLEGLLGDGYSVLAVYMPLNAVFNTNISVSENGGWDAHNEIFANENYQPKTGSRLKYFLGPVAAYLNYLTARSSSDNFPVYSDFSMVGFSGGGWATTVYAAIDPRIGVSISVAGSMPLYLRSLSIGDAEQTYEPFYSIAGYPDLYVMASYGSNRRQIQVLNRNDLCCFSQVVHNAAAYGGLSFDVLVREFELNVRNSLVSLGDRDFFRVEIDEAALGHMVTWDAIYDTILPELNGSRRHLATASGSEAVGSGFGQTPMFLTNGILGTVKLPLMIGKPTIIRGGVNIYDLFYRTGDNRLVHSSRPPAVWSRPVTLTEKAIADPVSASPQAGRFDIVVIKNDYKLYHFMRNGPVNSVQVVSDFEKGLGEPTLIATAPNQLDLFYKSFNKKLYHARKIGNESWVVKEVGGRLVNFPTAVRLSDGSFRAYVRGLNGELWESRLDNSPNAQWVGWFSVSAQAAADGTIEGSPSAALVNGQVNVFVRSKSSKIRRFVFDKSWTYTDYDGSYSGSPTSTPAGTFVRGANGSIFRFNGSSWTEFGGYID